LPKTPLGKWSAGLAVASILFFALGGALFPFDPSAPRFNPVPALVVIIVVMGISGAAVVTGLISMIKNNERSVFAFLSTAIGLWVLTATAVSLYVVSKSGTVQAIKLTDAQRPSPCSLAALL
jgi:drug/metabolite transporter (DMT)-like permease